MSNSKQSCQQRIYEVTMAQLYAVPLSCPMDGMKVWDAHPKVFLPIMKIGKAVCPYCETLYILTDFDPSKATDVTDTESE